MNPLRIRARNYRSFETLDLELPTGCCAVLGDNGAGKSSVINAIDLCLFGPAGRSFEPYLTEGDDQVDLELELTFEHAGELYRARRGFSARGRGKTTLDLEYRDDGGGLDPAYTDAWEPLTRENAKATQELIEQLLGLTRDTFRASAFLAQGDGASFTEADPRDRKRILAEIIGINIWGDLLELVRRDKRAAEQHVERLGGLMGHADEELARVDDLERQLKVLAEIETAAVADLATAENALAEAGARQQELQQQASARRELAAKVDAARVAFDSHEQQRQQAAAAKKAIEATKAELATLPVGEVGGLEQEEAELRGRIAANERALAEFQMRAAEASAATHRKSDFDAAGGDLRAKAHTLREQATTLEQPTEHAQTCDRCGQTLGDHARATAIASLRDDADKLDGEAARLDEQARGIDVPDVGPEPTLDEDAAGALTAILGKLNVARAAQAERAALDERLAGLRRQADVGSEVVFMAELAALRDRLAIAEGELRRLEPIDPAEIQKAQTAGLQAKAWVEQERTRLEQARRERAIADTELARLRELEAKLAAARAEREELRLTLDQLAILERAYGRDGIPALIVSNTALPAIEVEATRILQELGTSYRVELRTERELKGGGVGDTLDVILITEAGERPYETLSGGERTRLNLALRIALARLLAHRRGAESRLLALDEPDGLDAPGMHALAGVLQGLTGDFEKIYVASHVPDLAGAFDQVLHVQKVDGRSVIAA